MRSADAGLARYTLLTHLLDQAFRVPGTSLRFGLDAIIGLIPGAGDIAGAVFGLYGVWVARQLGAPAPLLARMLGNLAIDAIVGAVPLIGDLFDFGFKPHVRNVVLVEKWLASPHAVERRSAAMLLAIPLTLALVVVIVLWLTVAALRWLASTIG
ncbi:MAG: DUF4112 domain-containing protein [Gammaproteobacteria bacterium]